MWQLGWAASVTCLLFGFHNVTLCSPDRSSSVITLTCIKPWQPCSCFKKPPLQRHSPRWLPSPPPPPPPLMPFPDACQRPCCSSLCGFVTSWLPYFAVSSLFLISTSSLVLLLCISVSRHLIILGGLQMVSAVRQNKDVPLSLCCCLIACSTAWKLMHLFLLRCTISTPALSPGAGRKKIEKEVGALWFMATTTNSQWPGTIVTPTSFLSALKQRLRILLKKKKRIERERRE